MKFDIINRFTGAVQFTADIECADDSPTSIKLGLAVRWAIKSDASLAGAYLARANLADANLAGAYLPRANLADANIAGANLARASLADAYLVRANLEDASLAGAYLAHANLARANLAGAYLARAYLARANLAGAYLAGAYLEDANLADAKWRDGVVISRTPIQIYGLYWPVTILDEHMQIGCELHRLNEWKAFDDARIGRMDARHAKKFWAENKEALLSMARNAGRSFEEGPSDA